MGTVAKTTERTMPTTIRRIALAALFLAWPALAAARFTVVVDGKIASVDAQGTLVSAKAVTELAKLSGHGVSFDPAAGVVSVTKGGGAVDDGFKSFAGTSFTFVVDGKIVKAAGKSVGGVPFLASKDVEKIAKAMGFQAELDAAAGVLAATKPAPAAASGGGTTASFGLDGSFLKSVGGASSAAAGASSGNPVCAYMDDMRITWLATEPTPEEKNTFKNLAKVFDEKRRKKAKGTPEELKVLEDTLKGFNAKVQQRIQGTKDSTPPSGAEPWKSVSMEFLEKVDAVMRISLDLCRIYKLPKDKQDRELEKAKKYVDELPKLNSAVQSIGARQVEETIRVRDANGCSPP